MYVLSEAHKFDSRLTVSYSVRELQSPRSAPLTARVSKSSWRFWKPSFPSLKLLKDQSSTKYDSDAVHGLIKSYLNAVEQAVERLHRIPIGSLFPPGTAPLESVPQTGAVNDEHLSDASGRSEIIQSLRIGGLVRSRYPKMRECIARRLEVSLGDRRKRMLSLHKDGAYVEYAAART